MVLSEPTRRRLRLSIVIVVLLNSACSSSQSPAAQQKSLETILSWLQATSLVADAWEQQKVTRSYVKVALNAAVDGITAERNQLGAANPNIIVQTDAALGSVTKMFDAIKQNDESSFRQVREQLKIQTQLLASQLPNNSPSP
jgi:ABC-type glycerol-3-phosphate transport system substrate-binding protein